MAELTAGGRFISDPSRDGGGAWSVLWTDETGRKGVAQSGFKTEADAEAFVEAWKETFSKQKVVLSVALSLNSTKSR